MEERRGVADGSGCGMGSGAQERGGGVGEEGLMPSCVSGYKAWVWWE